MRGNIKSFEKPFTHAEVVALAERTLKRFGGDVSKAGRYARSMEDRYESSKWAQVVEVLSTSHATIKKSPAQLEREIAESLAKKPKDEIIARRQTADGKEVALWSDGSLTWGRWNVIKGSPQARTPAQIEQALQAGWLVIGEIELYDSNEVPRLIEVARKIARRGGDPGDVRAEFAKSAPLRPQWTVQEADRDGRPRVRVWRLPRLSHPGLAIWDETRGSRGRGRYQVMREIGRSSGTYEPTGIQFHDLASLQKHLRETSELGSH